MNTMETIFSRKSIRSYTGEKITEDELQTILKAAYAAPVGRAEYDSLTMTVISNPELLKKIDAAGAKFFNKPDFNPLYNTPMLIVVSSKLSGTPMDNIAYSNAATIVQNMALTAAELGVGACHIWGAIMAIANVPKIIKELNLLDGYSPCCAIALGKTDEKYETREIDMGRIKTIVIE